MTWLPFTAALALFFVLHTVPVRPAVKGRIVARAGSRAFSLGYSALSLVTLTILIVAAGRAPYVELWPQALWTRHTGLAVMAVAVAILALGIARPNPLSFGGARNDRFDPRHSGIVGWVRHPLLAAIGLWSLAHLIANGDLAHVILFGLFAAFSVLGMKLIDRRKRRELGADWDRLTSTNRTISLTRNGFARLTLAVALYGVLIVLHGPVIGAYPLG